jgi:RimJ/RimL family protein N-acetyltransferase
MYKNLSNNEFHLGDYSVVALRAEDIIAIKNWRNAQMDVLRQKNILTDEGQIRYYEEVVKPSFVQDQPKMVLFSYLENNNCIGYGGLTNIDWESKRIELSFLIDHKRKNDSDLYKKDFSNFIALIKRIVFEEMYFNRIFTETYDIRPLHISILEENGFRLEGRLKEHVVINGKYVDSLVHGFIKEYYNV